MNLYDYQIDLLRSPLYTASPLFLNIIRWSACKDVDSTSLVLVNGETHGKAAICVVGCLSFHKICVDPKDALSEYKNVRDLKQEYKLHMTKPYGTPFAGDFDNALLHLGRVQTEVAGGKDFDGLIVLDNLQKDISFSQSFFLEAVCMQQAVFSRGPYITHHL